MTNKFDELYQKNSNVKEEYDRLNADLGYSIEPLNDPKDEVLGREKEIHRLKLILNRRLTPVAILIGEAGTGKTALVETYNKDARMVNPYQFLFQIGIGKMNSDGDTQLKKRVEIMFIRFKEFEDFLKREVNEKCEIVVFIDEVHTIVSVFGSGSKIGGDLLKRSLARKYVKVIAATTRGEYDAYIASDAPLARRFKPIELNEVSQGMTHKIIRNWLKTYKEKDDEMLIEDRAYEEIITANRLYREQSAEPAKSIDVIESALAEHEVDNVPIDKGLVHKIFKEQYNIDLDFKINAKIVSDALKERVKGQPLALFTLNRMLKQIQFKLEMSNKPQATALFVGPTGVGKTETTKALATSIYGDERAMFVMNMPDYATEDSESRFRQILGEAIYHNPSSIVLFDEIEKAHPFILQDLLPILDEGRVSYETVGADGFTTTRVVSLRNTIVIGTSNAASELFQESGKYKSNDANETDLSKINDVTPKVKLAWVQSRNSIITGLQNAGFKPEVLGRFDHIIPFYSLSEPTLIAIAESKIDKIRNQFRKRGYSVKIRAKRDWSKEGFRFTATELAIFIVFEMAQSNDSNSGGARNIARIINTEFVSSIVDAISEKPNEQEFVTYVTDEAAINSGGKSIAGSGEIKTVTLRVFEAMEKKKNNIK